MAKGKYDCAICGALLPTAREHASHVTEKHDRGYVPRGSRMRMYTMRCWRCAVEMVRDEDNQYRCSCGFVMPDKEVLTNNDARNDPEQLSVYSTDAVDISKWPLTKPKDR